MVLLRSAVRAGHRAGASAVPGVSSSEEASIEELRGLVGASRLVVVRGRRGSGLSIEITELDGSGWTGAAELRDWAGDLEDGLDPMLVMLRERGESVTRCRADVYDDLAWGANSVVRARRERFGIAECVYSVIWRGEEFLLLAAFRQADNPKAFDAWDALVLDVTVHVMMACAHRGDRRVLAEVEALFTPKVRAVLKKLLEGYSEKEIAAQLHVAPSTVHSHVVSIYRRLNVASRAELMSLLLTGVRPSRPRNTERASDRAADRAAGPASEGDK